MRRMINISETKDTFAAFHASTSKGTVEETEAYVVGNLVYIHIRATKDATDTKTYTNMYITDSKLKPDHDHPLTGVRFCDKDGGGYTGFAPCYGFVNADGNIVLYNLYTDRKTYIDVTATYTLAD